MKTRIPAILIPFFLGVVSGARAERVSPVDCDIRDWVPTQVLAAPAAVVDFNLACTDVDGDGRVDAFYSTQEAHDPLVSGVHGIAVGWRGMPGAFQEPGWWTASGFPGLRLGRTLAAAGDVNGDGFGDLLVGASPLPSSGIPPTAHLYLGSPMGLSTTPDWQPPALPAGTFAYEVLQGSLWGRATTVEGNGIRA